MPRAKKISPKGAASTPTLNAGMQAYQAGFRDGVQLSGSLPRGGGNSSTTAASTPATRAPRKRMARTGAGKTMGAKGSAATPSGASAAPYRRRGPGKKAAQQQQSQD